VLNQDKAAVLFGLEMAIQKYGSRIACTGTVEWKRMVTKTAAQHGIAVQFTDEEMQNVLRLQQRLANPRQRQQERGGR
jgi:Tfp pilus assembly protein PilZ